MQQPLPKKDYGKDFRGIVRIAGKEIKGELTLERGLYRIRGIGLSTAKNLASAIEREFGISKKTLVGKLTDEQIEKVEEVLKAPETRLSKAHLLNRPVDPASGLPRHIIANDLIFAQRMDIQFEKDARSWRGWRHSMGQRVRGQHSRTTGRTGISVGVLKKAIKAQKAAAATKAQDSGAPKEKEKK